MAKFVRRDKLVDMQVYDKKGRFVGTVKDIGFIPGENTVGLVVTTKDRSEVEVHWSEVASIEDIVILERDFPGPDGGIAMPDEEGEKIIIPPLKQAEAPEKETPVLRQEQGAKTRLKVCPKCGAENDPKYKYCHKCGAKLGAVS
jgi:sporulation protein YlmC with PRC-barrel domain